MSDIELSNMRKVIASRLLESKTTIPHYYLTSEINMDNLMKYVGGACRSPWAAQQRD
jgi:pyruvate/2-oxoglutarate dehydrogenase complex dihydrolipoamide acyltransferase (E2) component